MTTILFYGCDGSGKSSLAKAIAQNLNNQGQKVKISWMRGTHTFAYILAKLLSKFETFKGPDNPYYKISIPQNYRRFWQFLEFISVLPIVLVKIVIPNSLGYYVISERCVLDFIAWVSTTTNDKYFIEKIEARFLLILASKANTKVYVTADFDSLLQRRQNSNPHFIKAQTIFYEKITQMINAHRLDTTKKSVKESCNEVLNILNAQ